jgi:pilus assembly protein CpaB
MKFARLAILGIAVIAGGGAAVLVSRDDPPPAPAPAPVAQIDVVDVLVAKRDIGIGAALSAQDVGWQSWPTASVPGHFLKRNDRPAAAEQLAGSMTRVPFAAGEPIREDKLIKGSGSGYMAAVLPPGMRAISTPISPETGAGGFILPNDRVDVLLIRAQKTSAGEVYTSETLLANVRVLAIDQTVEEKGGQRVVVGKIATLALNSRSAETLALATRLGTLALVLRSLSDGQKADIEENERTGFLARDSVNVVRFGQTVPTFK